MIIELILVIAVISVMLLIIGVNPEIIVSVLFLLIIGILWLALVLTVIYFAVQLIFLLMTRKTTGEFLRLEQYRKRETRAVYLVNGQEEFCTFPALITAGWMYPAGKQRTVHQKKWNKLRLLFDIHGIIGVVTGLPLSVLLLYAMERFIEFAADYFP